MNTTPLTLHDLTTRTGIEVFDYLERSIAIPVTDQPQAQGDLLVIPAALLRDEVTVPKLPQTSATIVAGGRFALTAHVGPSGVEVLRSTDGGNPHTLVADPETCTWTTGVRDSRRLALGIVETTAVAYLIHPEHGATGIAPGRYVIRRQRELGFTGFGSGFDERSVMYVAD